MTLYLCPVCSRPDEEPNLVDTPAGLAHADCVEAQRNTVNKLIAQTATPEVERTEDEPEFELVPPTPEGTEAKEPVKRGRGRDTSQ